MLDVEEAPHLAAFEGDPFLGQFHLQAIQRPMASGQHIPYVVVRRALISRVRLRRQAACLGDHPPVGLLVVGAGTTRAARPPASPAPRPRRVRPAAAPPSRLLRTAAPVALLPGAVRAVA